MNISIHNYLRPKGRVLFVGQSYYHAWYLSRALRKLGWKADVLNWDTSPTQQIYYHGEDYKFSYYGNDEVNLKEQWRFYIKAIFNYDIFHFSNKGGIMFGSLVNTFVKDKDYRLNTVHFYGYDDHIFDRRLRRDFLDRWLKSDDLKRWIELKSDDLERWLKTKYLDRWLKRDYEEYAEIRLLKRLKKKIVYSHSGCHDGVSQTAFSKWPGPEPVCDACSWKNTPIVCCDEGNLAWGKVRNEMADYQCTVGGNRADYNDDPRVHEVPEFYCLDPDLWRPDLAVPPQYHLNFPENTVKLYHSVGNYESRTEANNRNTKSSHIYFPLVDRLKSEGYNVEIMFFTNVPNKEIRFYQVQADIFIDMLTYGFFGATAREGMMLGKPVICYLRPEWLESMREEIPEYVEELPIVSATPQTIESVLKDLLEHPEKRQEIGRRGRKFAVKWHSAEGGARRMDQIYSKLLHIKAG